jgi:hypothetical protein
MSSLIKLILIIIFVIVLLLVGPLAVIWSVNVLARTDIPYTFDTWIAIVVLGAFLRANVTVKK